MLVKEKRREIQRYGKRERDRGGKREKKSTS